MRMTWPRTEMRGALGTPRGLSVPCIILRRKQATTKIWADRSSVMRRGRGAPDPHEENRDEVRAATGWAFTKRRIEGPIHTDRDRDLG